MHQRQTSEARGDPISPLDMWSRRSFIKAGAGYGGFLLLNARLTEEVAAIQQTAFGRKRSTDLTTLTIGEAGDLVRRKAISPVELTLACLRRIERLNPVLNGLHHRDRR